MEERHVREQSDEAVKEEGDKTRGEANGGSYHGDQQHAEFNFRRDAAFHQASYAAALGHLGAGR